jgi:hypothetical protein
MPDPSLEDQLKQAEIEKTHAEAAKLLKEANAITKPGRGAAWLEAIKIGGALIIGLGGVIAAVTQYEIAELRVTMAEHDIELAERDLAAAEQAKAAAIAETDAAVARRDAAVKERLEAEEETRGFKASLAEMASQVETRQPGILKARLVFVQFRGDIMRSRIDDLRKTLSKDGFNAPGAERVDGRYQNLVKYFSPEDHAEAERLAQVVEKHFASKGCPLDLRVVPATAPSGKNPPLEVWLSHSCE